MKSRWNATDAAAHTGAIGGCVYCSRLIGSDPSLVLHGGGNSSVKAPYHDITGADVDAVWVKGSGWDMATIETGGFAALRTGRLHQLLELDTLTDADMARELRAAKLDPSHPQPSVESLLHAFLPYRSVLHSHADAIVTLTNVTHGDRYVRNLYRNDALVVPYVMPGFDLARLVRDQWRQEAAGDESGMVLMNHGLFTFGDDDRAAYERHIELINRAEEWLDSHAPRSTVIAAGRTAPSDDAPAPAPVDVPALRQRISAAAGRPMVVQTHDNETTRRFVARDDLADIASSGPLTPDHVIRTKRLPLIGIDVDGYVADYRAYVEANRSRKPDELESIDPAPRVVLHPDLGMLTCGETWNDAKVSADIYHRTIPVIERATDHLDGYQALPAGDIFDVEYWDLEQAKLRARPKPAELTGQIALVTGAASGIGLACARDLAAQGAVVVGVDVADAIEEFDVGPGALGVRSDLTDPGSAAVAVDRAIRHAGGVDIVVLSAGILGSTAPLAELSVEAVRRVHDINFNASLAVMGAAHAALKHAPAGGKIVAIASKNVPAPGAGAAAYSTSKAALTQLVRLAAIEWAADDIRVNGVHPDAVFDTGLWDDETIARRARDYGLTVEEYRTRNLLNTTITSADIARTVTALCTDRFRVTTGCLVPTDGGNDRVI